MVIGSNQGDRGERRIDVRDQLDRRQDATGYRLEDFGLTRDEMHLWAAGFDLLAAMATHVPAVLEDFDGGHTWELGELYPDRRSLLWLLRRVYADAGVMRDRYDHSMAASHVEEMLEYDPDRVIDWRDPDDLPDAVRQIP